MPELLTCAKCCTIFSFTGIVFLIIIGSLLQTQPLYIKGPSDSAKAATGCYQGAMIYAATFLISLGYWTFSSMRSKATNMIDGRGGGRRVGSGSTGGKYGAVVTNAEL